MGGGRGKSTSDALLGAVQKPHGVFETTRAPSSMESREETWENPPLGRSEKKKRMIITDGWDDTVIRGRGAIRVEKRVTGSLYGEGSYPFA